MDVLRVKKARRWVWALATTKDYEHSLIESLVSVMHALTTPCVVELLLTPAPTLLERYTGHALARRERRFMADRRFGPNEPGADGVVAKKHLQGAVEGVGRAWWWFDLRVIVPRGHEPHARQVAGVIQETRGENYLRVRVMRVRRRLYAWRSGRGLPPLFPALWSGALSSAEVASLWHLPTLRLKGVPLRRISAREIAATSAISRDPAHAVMRDEHGPVGIHPADRRYGWMLLGTAGAGKTAALAPHVRAVAEDDERALVIIDPKEDFARLCMGLIPTRRTVHYLDLGAPRYGLNILTAGHLTPEIRADIFISVIRELAGESSVGPRSDLFLRAALQAVMIVEPVPALQHVAALLDPYDAGYREWVTRELRGHHEIDFVRDYWERTFPQMVKHNPRFFAEAVAAPTNKIARFLTSPSLNLLMTHPVQLDLESIIRRREILIVNGSKGAVGESNANLFCSMLILLIQRALHQMQRVEAQERVQAALVIDEAHNVFIPAFSTLLAEGRSGGLEVAAAFQYTGQIADESVRAGVRSLLQNVSIFRQRDFQDARAAAALAMEVFQDNISGDVEDQRRIRIDPIDIVQQPNYRAVNLWLANGVPQPAATASTQPMEELVATPEAREAPPAPRARTAFCAATTRMTTGATYSRRWCGRSCRPIVARYRTIHIDLPAWRKRPPLAEIVRVALVLKPPSDAPLAYAAEPSEESLADTRSSSRRRTKPRLAPGRNIRCEVLACVRGEPEPRTGLRSSTSERWASNRWRSSSPMSRAKPSSAAGVRMTVASAEIAARAMGSGQDLSAGAIQWGWRESRRRSVALTERDLRMMAMLYDANYLSASQLVLLGWGEYLGRAGERRLKRLHDNCYVDRFRPLRAVGSARVELPAERARFKALAEHDMAPAGHAYTPAGLTSISYAEHDLQLAAWSCGSPRRRRASTPEDSWTGCRFRGRALAPDESRPSRRTVERSPAAVLPAGTALYQARSRQRIPRAGCYVDRPIGR